MTTATSIGELLRQWRQRNRLSQMDLALLAGCSTRHVSFIETGRATPSRDMILRLADQLRVPLRERNNLLTVAGYAPIYPNRPLTSPAMAAAHEALVQVLRGHEPYPAIVLDTRWDLVMGNAAAELFFEDVDADLLTPPVNMMRVGLHPRGFAARVANLDEVRAQLMSRLSRQVHASADPELTNLYRELQSYYPDDAPEAQAPDMQEVALPIRVRHRGTELVFFNTITTFGTPIDITLDEVVIESYFPADDATARHMRAL